MKDITGILLAAGQSTRFISNKLLYKLDNGSSIAQQSAKNLIEVFPNSIAVINTIEDENSGLFSDYGLINILNNQHKSGIGSSIACAIKNIGHAQACVIALADMPFIKIETFKLIRDKMTDKKCIVAPSHKGQRGHPVLFSQHFFDELAKLNDDMGAKKLIKQNLQYLTLVEVDDTGILKDIDILEDINNHKTPHS